MAETPAPQPDAGTDSTKPTMANQTPSAPKESKPAKASDITNPKPIKR